MKKLLLFLLTITALSGASFAQDTIPSQDTTAFQSFFGRESTEWRGAIWEYDWAWGGMLQMGSDTVIDGKQYKKIEYSHSEIFDGNYYEWREPDYDFYLREDTATGRLWYRFPDRCFRDSLNWDFWFGQWEHWYEEEYQPEILITDMSLSIGDTFAIYNFEWHRKNICTVVDTSTVNHRRTVVLQPYDGEPITFTEGIGCSNLLMYGLFEAIGSKITCCHKDGELAYHWQSREDDGNCIPSYVGIDDRESSQTISLHPNPCTDKVWISGENIQSVTLIDIKGDVMKTAIDVHQPLDVSTLSPGAYILRLVTNNVVLCKILIKK